MVVLAVEHCQFAPHRKSNASAPSQILDIRLPTSASFDEDKYGRSSLPFFLRSRFPQPFFSIMSRYHYCLLLIALFSSHLAVPVSAKYRARNKHFRENFDPAEADPKRNITCIGSAYGMDLPIIESSHFNPNGHTMQALCAKPQYGGSGPLNHAGAYCYGPIAPGEPSDSGSEPEDWMTASTGSGSSYNGSEDGTAAVMLGKVIFDPHPGALASSQLQNPRFMQACLYRCFCNYGLDDVSQQPLSNHYPTELWDAEDGYELKIDVENDYTTPIEDKMGDPSRGIVESYIFGKMPQIDSRGAGYLVHTSRMNMDPGNEIECSGALPEFAFPSPFTQANFSSNQELCAVALSGGNK